MLLSCRTGSWLVPRVDHLVRRQLRSGGGALNVCRSIRGTVEHFLARPLSLPVSTIWAEGHATGLSGSHSNQQWYGSNGAAGSAKKCPGRAFALRASDSPNPLNRPMLLISSNSNIRGAIEGAIRVTCSWPKSNCAVPIAPDDCPAPTISSAFSAQ